MPEVAYMKVDGVEGECNVKNHSGEIEVLQFDHDVSKDVDPLDCSKVRGDRRHGKASIVKIFCKATPLLNQKLCEGGTIDQIEIKWYRQPAGGGSDPEHYFTHTFKDCILTSMKPCMPNALDETKRAWGHTERMEWGYRELTWKSETGGTEFNDAVRE